ncbi:secreted ectonucleotide pyrophosphatase/phosphodiesterase-like protein [Sarcoptes scabiei]|uniref:Secreted ectonucleotide pyrophosphatase/phosphodiesterase-like protein n=1 Tax=Sarcoptes scabiei TaxID=52283 RepID=A0A131ZZL3_SARSC|nr:secreted ectonucleotide pyrophosphatase/phosphodiesterase-like protein [Sarcoptes scabiei]
MSSLAFANENLLQSYKLIVLSFDGFRNDYIDPERTPNLFAVANAGVQGHMKSTFVTKTYPNHQSIATGLYQPWHGIVNNRFYDPDMKAFFDVDSPSSAWWDQKNISVPIYIANQFYNRNQRYSISIQWPGSIASYSNGKNSDDRMRVHYLQDFDPSIDWYKRIDLLLSWLQHPLRPANMAFVYFSEPDRHAHEYGPFSTEVLDQVKKLDSVVGYLRQKLLNANLAHRTNVIYLSDHGMAEVRAERSFFIDKCDQEYSGLKYELIGVSPVYSLRPISKPLSINGTLEQSVREALNQCAIKHFENSFKVYLLDEIPENFYYRDNNRILSMILLAKDGYDINYKDHHWRPKGYPIWGNHGYNNSEPSMRPLFLAQGPRFKRSYKHSKLFENVDLYPLMLNLLEIPIEQFPSNGSFERVQQMLSKELYLDADDILQRNSISSSSNQTWVRC